VRKKSLLTKVTKPVFIFRYQVVPHITDEIQDWIERVAMNPVDGKEGSPDVCVIELGGTIGEHNNLLLLT
jgi:CTP synthase (UTP-ammonia lyase)